MADRPTAHRRNRLLPTNLPIGDIVRNMALLWFARWPSREGAAQTVSDFLPPVLRIERDSSEKFSVAA
jgi:hypothetical protein